MKKREIRRLGPLWYGEEEFWHLYAPYIFGPDRWATAPKEAADIAALLELKAGAPVLDACCGVGRHSVELARRGYRVTGIDLNQDYLKAAAGTADAEGVKVDFICQDILQLDMPELFDAAINVYTSFGYFSSPQEDLQLLGRLFTSLRPGGRLLVETMSKENLARDFVPSEWYQEGQAYVLAEYRVLDDFGRLENRWIIVEEDKTYDYTFSHRLYSALELKTLFSQTGFVDIKAYGSFSGAPYDNQAQVLAVVGSKPF